MKRFTYFFNDKNKTVIESIRPREEVKKLYNIVEIQDLKNRAKEIFDKKQLQT